MSRMLSTTWISHPGWRLTMNSSSSSARAPVLLRNAIVWPLRPQKVQCFFSPHQQPREGSKNRRGCHVPLKPVALNSAKKSSKSGYGSASMSRTGGALSNDPKRNSRFTVSRVFTPSRPASEVPLKTRCTISGKIRSPSPDTAASTNGNWRTVSAPMTPSQFEPPKTMAISGARAFSRRASASDATCCWKTLVKPISRGRSARMSPAHSSRNGSTCRRLSARRRVGRGLGRGAASMSPPQRARPGGSEYPPPSPAGGVVGPGRGGNEAARRGAIEPLERAVPVIDDRITLREKPRVLRIAAQDRLHLWSDAGPGGLAVAPERARVERRQLRERAVRQVADERVEDRQGLVYPAAQRERLAVGEPDAGVVQIAGVLRREGLDGLLEPPFHCRQHGGKHP